MPVCNEEAAVETVVSSWTALLDRLQIDYELLVFDDGSTDRTGRRLDALASRMPRLRVTHQANRGHGPTILRGYRAAAGQWVFQTDSDDEIPATAFEDLWRRRCDADVVAGARSGRASGAARRAITRAAAAIVHGLYGRTVSDVNVPFRLMRREVLTRMLARIPDDTFAPNVMLSGLCARDRLSWIEVPVHARPRTTGQTSLFGRKVWAAAWRAGWQTAASAARERFGRRDS